MLLSRPIFIALLFTPLLPLAPAGAQAIGDRPVLNVDGSPDYATQDRYSFSDNQTGISAGPLDLFPSAAVSAAYDSNVFASPTLRRESALSVTQGLLQVTSEPGELLYFDGEGYARQRRFASASDQDTNEYGGSGAFSGELSAKDELKGSLMSQRRFEARTDIETPDIEPVSLYNQWLGTLDYMHTYNRLDMTYLVTGQQLEYENPSQRHRDRTFYEGTATAAYQLPDGLALLATGFHSEDSYRYDSPLVAGGQTSGARFGARASIPEFVDFELTAGYFHRAFDEHLGDISGLTVSGGVVFHLTALTTIRATVTREDQPTRIPGAYGKVRTDSLLELGHAYRHDINLYARARVVVDDFATISRTDTTYLGEVGGFYELSRGFVVAVEYDFSERSSPVVGANFLQHLLSVSLIGRL